MEHVIPAVHIWGIEFDLAAIIMILISSTIVYVIAMLAVRNASVENPTPMQNFLEWVIEFVINIIGSTMDIKKGRTYLTLGIALIMYIFVSNMLGLPLNFITTVDADSTIFGLKFILPEGAEHAHVAWWKSPTADVAITSALMAIVIVLTHIEGLRRNRKHYLKHYIEPYVAFLPLNLIKEVSKPLSLSLRLYGNIFAGEVMIAVIMGLGWVGIPALIVWQGFSLFVGAIQSFVFVMLMMVYMSQSIIHEDH